MYQSILIGYKSIYNTIILNNLYVIKLKFSKYNMKSQIKLLIILDLKLLFHFDQNHRTILEIY